MTSGVAYPATLSITRPESQSRLTNFPLIGFMIRSLLAIPHAVILYFFGIAASIVVVVATFAILFSGAFPAGMRTFVVGYIRWNLNVTSYLYHLFDNYPPFSADQQSDFPLHIEVEPQEVSKWLNFPILGMTLKSILLIPHFVVLWLLGLAAFVVIVIATFAILFTGSFPVDLHRFVTGYVRWSLRISCYLFALTDAYPPFSMN